MSNTQLNITVESADVYNFLSAVAYLKDLLATTDVSDDFAGSPEDYVTAYDLLTDNNFYKAITKAAGV